MPSIDSLKFDTAGWTLKQASSDARLWTNSKEQVVTLEFFDKPPDIPYSLTDLATMRATFRQGLSQSGQALVSADVLSANRLDCIQLVLKVPQKPRGMTYVGCLTFPFEKFSYVAKIGCSERGTTGMRDTIVFDKMMQEGTVTFDAETRSFRGWSADPYDPTFKATLLRNRSDDELYDASFPDHPLTDVRSCLSKILITISADESVLAAARFRG